ncbi:MAG: chlorophyllide a reductase subunit Z, partial [Chlorobiaceae bacterium]|nr:chlorophyllide a reductase subunit Z [Chlorobiaceae bacterium]
MDYTDAIPYLENLTPTSLTEREIASSGSAEVVRKTIEALLHTGKRLILVSSAESEMIGSDHQGMLAMNYPSVRFFPSDSLGENEWKGRDRALAWLFDQFDDGAPAEILPGSVSIIGPTYGCFNSPSDLAEIKRLITGAGGTVHHVYPFESKAEDIAALKHSAVVVQMYREFGGKLAEKLGRPALHAPYGLQETSQFITDIGSLAGSPQQAARFIEEEKRTTLKPLWDLWRGPQSEWFPTIRFGVVASKSYSTGIAHFLADEMGMLCLFSHDSAETDNSAVREEIQQKQPQFLFGRMPDKIYLAEIEAKTRFIPAGFPGPIVRRALGTPVMGHSGAVLMIQEIVNALYDMLFNFLPITRRQPVAAAPTHPLYWTPEANTLLEEIVRKAPFISQISFGRELKRKAETMAITRGLDTITPELLKQIS